MRLAVLAILIASRVAAQELEPRSYSASPIGTSFLVVAYSYSTGGILLDPTVPITDGRAKVSGFALGYGHVFAIGGMQAMFTATLPYASGPFSGKVGASPTDSTVHRAGIGDARLKVSMIFLGSPALAPAAFVNAPPRRFLFGGSLTVIAPTGQYDPEKLINIGANRWAFKPELGVSYNWHSKLYLDFYTGCWFFATNPNTYTGASTLTQDPLVSLQFHASYVFLPRFYVSLQSTWYNGGATQLNEGPSSARTDNSRLGVLVAYGFTRTQSVKLSYSYGATVRVGSAYETLALAYQVLWF